MSAVTTAAIVADSSAVVSRLKKQRSSDAKTRKADADAGASRYVDGAGRAKAVDRQIDHADVDRLPLSIADCAVVVDWVPLGRATVR